MSKYNLEEIHKSNVREAMSADDQARFDQLTKDDQLKLEKIFSMMRAEKDAIKEDALQEVKVGDILSKDGKKGKVTKISDTTLNNKTVRWATVDFGNGDVDGIALSRIKGGEIEEAKGMMEDFDSVVDKIKDSGKSEEDAKKIAGAINAKYVGNYREGVEENGTVNDYTEEIAEENDEDKLPMDEARIDRDVAERIESLLDRSMKAKFIDAFMDIYSDLLEEDNFFPEDIINHLSNEMNAELAGYQRQGDRLAGLEENHAMQGVEAELESGEIGNMDALAEDDSAKDLLDKIRKYLKGSDRNFQDNEIEMYIDSLKRDIKRGEFDGVESVSMEDHEEDLINYIDDKALQEHFGRFLKDYQ